MRRHGYIAVLFLSLVYVFGIYMAMYWSNVRSTPVPALVPIVPCMWIVLAAFEVFDLTLNQNLTLALVSYIWRCWL